MRGSRGADGLTRVELSAGELDLLVLALETHCQECFAERLHRQMDALGRKLARLQRGEEVRD